MCLFIFIFSLFKGPAFLGHCATSRKVAALIPDEVIQIFQWRNPFGRTLALGSTQSLTEMSTRNISWMGKGWRCVGLTTLPPSCYNCLEIWKPQLSGTISACPGLYWDLLYLYLYPYVYPVFLLKPYSIVWMILICDWGRMRKGLWANFTL